MKTLPIRKFAFFAIFASLATMIIPAQSVYAGNSHVLVPFDDWEWSMEIVPLNDNGVSIPVVFRGSALFEFDCSLVPPPGCGTLELPEDIPVGGPYIVPTEMVSMDLTSTELINLGTGFPGLLQLTLNILS